MDNETEVFVLQSLFGRNMNRVRTSRISLGVFAGIIVLTAFIPSSPPDLAPILGIAALAAIPAIVAGPKEYRLLGVVAVLLAICFVGVQLYEGRKLHDRIQQIRANAGKVRNTTEVNTPSDRTH